VIVSEQSRLLGGGVTTFLRELVLPDTLALGVLVRVGAFSYPSSISHRTRAVTHRSPWPGLLHLRGRPRGYVG